MSGATCSPGKIPEKELVECLTQEGGGGGDGGGGKRRDVMAGPVGCLEPFLSCIARPFTGTVLLLDIRLLMSSRFIQL